MYVRPFTSYFCLGSLQDISVCTDVQAAQECRNSFGFSSMDDVAMPPQSFVGVGSPQPTLLPSPDGLHKLPFDGEWKQWGAEK